MPRLVGPPRSRGWSEKPPSLSTTMARQRSKLASPDDAAGLAAGATGFAAEASVWTMRSVAAACVACRLSVAVCRSRAVESLSREPWDDPSQKFTTVAKAAAKAPTVMLMMLVSSAGNALSVMMRTSRIPKKPTVTITETTGAPQATELPDLTRSTMVLRAPLGVLESFLLRRQFRLTLLLGGAVHRLLGFQCDLCQTNAQLASQRGIRGELALRLDGVGSAGDFLDDVGDSRCHVAGLVAGDHLDEFRDDGQSQRNERQHRRSPRKRQRQVHQ
jgi:hypothetical protein